MYVCTIVCVCVVFVILQTHENKSDIYLGAKQFANLPHTLSIARLVLYVLYGAAHSSNSFFYSILFVCSHLNTRRRKKNCVQRT